MPSSGIAFPSLQCHANVKLFVSPYSRLPSLSIIMCLIPYPIRAGKYDIKLKYGMTRERVPVIFSDPEEEARKALLLAEARARAGVPERSILRPSAASLSASAVSTMPGTLRPLYTGLGNGGMQRPQEKKPPTANA
ncbi:uncharacterized protein LOC125772020 [Anopheles funestus]|uniref:uncharacterized protein LOC125772020 n=1 Tax=Anopheles funestus TaxID=62324 RepID=UPI0020C70801|nr:uncharacterized protein LOC125772020 [Anopheles funestus]